MTDLWTGLVDVAGVPGAALLLLYAGLMAALVLVAVVGVTRETVRQRRIRARLRQRRQDGRRR